MPLRHRPVDSCGHDSDLGHNVKREPFARARDGRHDYEMGRNDATSEMAKRIELALEVRGMSKNALRVVAELPTGGLYKWLTGVRDPMTMELQTFMRIADALNVNAEWLLRGLGPFERADRPATLLPAREAH